MRIAKTFTLATVSFFMIFFLAAMSSAAEQTTCPVMGGTINKNLYEDYKGQRVYFCCMACPPQFKANPEKYIEKMKEMGQEPEIIGANKKG